MAPYPDPLTDPYDGAGKTLHDVDGDQLVPNLKRPAMKKVVDALKSAETDLDASPESGSTPKSHKLTTGLGGDGSVWKSPLANTSRDTIVNIIDGLTSEVSSTRQDVSDSHTREPRRVKESDPRATW